VAEEQETVVKSSTAAAAAVAEPEATPAVNQYWLRVHGYPSDLSREVVYYRDFADLADGHVSNDPEENLHPNDVIIYYADGPSIVYGVATVTGDVEGPFPDARLGKRWTVPIRRDAMIKAVDKAPPAVTLAPPSGLHFLSLVRDATYIRLPREDGEYLVAQVKNRAGPQKGGE
jgi:hypothetical protein